MLVLGLVAQAEREPGVNPGLPRSGKRERTPPSAPDSPWSGEAAGSRNPAQAGTLASPKTCQHSPPGYIRGDPTWKPRGRAGRSVLRQPSGCGNAGFLSPASPNCFQSPAGAKVDLVPHGPSPCDATPCSLRFSPPAALEGLPTRRRPCMPPSSGRATELRSQGRAPNLHPLTLTPPSPARLTRRPPCG